MEQEGNKEGKKVSDKALDKMTVKDLREMAKEIPGITGVHSMKKEQLLAILDKEARGGGTRSRGKKKSRAKTDMSVKELKESISRLREKKEKAREAEDRKALDILRHRISRLKRQTRKVAQG